MLVGQKTFVLALALRDSVTLALSLSGPNMFSTHTYCDAGQFAHNPDNFLGSTPLSYSSFFPLPPAASSQSAASFDDHLTPAQSRPTQPGYSHQPSSHHSSYPIQVTPGPNERAFSTSDHPYGIGKYASALHSTRETREGIYRLRHPEAASNPTHSYGSASSFHYALPERASSTRYSSTFNAQGGAASSSQRVVADGSVRHDDSTPLKDSGEFSNCDSVPTLFMYETPTPILQPPYQPSLGPTASNGPGSYGSFHPNGVYEAYRAAAMPNTPHHSQGQYGAREINDRPRRMQRSTALGQQSILPHRPLLNNGGNSSLSSRYSVSMTGRPLHANPVPLYTSMNINSNVLPLECETNVHSQRTRRTSLRSQNGQFKEKTLGWAHQVYVDLLASIHKTKFAAHPNLRKRGLQRSYSEAGIYPRPPRHTAFLLRRPSDPVFYNDKSPRPDLSMVRRGSAYNSSENRRHRSNSVLGVVETKRSYASRTAASGYPISRLNGAGRTESPLTQYFEEVPHQQTIQDTARAALELIESLCQESHWLWIDGMLLGGCLAYGLEQYERALEWYSKIIAVDRDHVEAISNLAATLFSLNRRQEAEKHWLRAIKLRPSYFDAVEHLVGLLCGDHRPSEAISIIEYVERALRLPAEAQQSALYKPFSDGAGSEMRTQEFLFAPPSLAETGTSARLWANEESKDQPGFGSSGYAVPGFDNGRILALVHAKGNLLYAQKNTHGASLAFEEAVLISTGRRPDGIHGLIRHIITVLSGAQGSQSVHHPKQTAKLNTVLLPPDKALQTASMAFAHNGQLPALHYLPHGTPRSTAISTTSNSLLSLAKIYQDSMSSGAQATVSSSQACGTAEILALYYLSLSLQPSPSTANNVGILLASIPQQNEDLAAQERSSGPSIPGVKPGSGVALALAYYNYGLNLDSRHAHLYTNLGSLLKDIGQLAAAIKMYEKAVACDGKFDIALANLANAVKDQGKIGHAIEYYKRAVASSPDFSEAVCGLANALNSVCDWAGRGGVVLSRSKHDRWHVLEDGMLVDASQLSAGSGWMQRVVSIVQKQLEDGANWGQSILYGQSLYVLLQQLEIADSGAKWSAKMATEMQLWIQSWIGKPWEGARIINIIERSMKRAMHRWYRDKYIDNRQLPPSAYMRPHVPMALSVPGTPTVLPFHTFTCPLSARETRMISERNALRISCASLRSPWLPQTVYPPPAPPNPVLNIGYVSSDFNNHPLAHLMQSVFGFHNLAKVKAFCYATTPSDNSSHRKQIEDEAPVFRDAGTWSTEQLVQQIVQDQIHILVNLNGYTRGAKNEVFAVRPAPIQMSFMGFAGTLGAEWCDYLLADEIAVPQSTLRPWRRNTTLEDLHVAERSAPQEDWVYSENIIFSRDTFFCCDHKQSSKDTQLSWPEEQERKWQMRRELFPELPDEAVIIGNFNQLYKIDPSTFRTWLRILSRVKNAVLWLLRFPELGEANLRKTARLWAGEEIASRIIFTDVAPKDQHISRARVCDLFLDTPECNAHTTAADILWSATPLLTLPRYEYKMCSRMAASILKGALPKTQEGVRAFSELVAADEEQYEEFAVELAGGLSYNSEGRGKGRLTELRRLLYESRQTSALFDTRRWVQDLETAYEAAWYRWEEGIGDDIYL